MVLRTGTCYRLGRREVPNTVVGMQMLAQLLAEWQDPTAGRLLIGIEEATAYGEALVCFLTQAGFSVVEALKAARFQEVLGADPDTLAALLRQASHGRLNPTTA